jgi:hypothetical protein
VPLGRGGSAFPWLCRLDRCPEQLRLFDGRLCRSDRVGLHDLAPMLPPGCGYDAPGSQRRNCTTQHRAQCALEKHSGVVTQNSRGWEPNTPERGSRSRA